ncbi:hypothetical protein BDF14DRAFT_1873692 [Spinellus fusiger]|nr:hypothetical protein BDF14DRAFT_1873692 [Spinellus fusiger]
MGTVHFNDRKVKWNRVTLQLIGKSGLSIEASPSIVPSETAFDANRTHLHTTITICDIEKELIFSGEKSIDFGLHLPIHLPPSIKTKHAFVKYELVVNLSAGPFKKHSIQCPVAVNRHYLPSPSAMIPSVSYHGVSQWFGWSVDVPKAVAVDSGEVVVALRWSVEKECMDVSRVELCIEQLEAYRFSLKNVVHNLAPVVTQFPSASYHPESAIDSSETHFIRTLIPNIDRTTPSMHVHHFSPFLEVTHRLRLVLHFSTESRVAPFVLEFPIIITEYPTTSDLSPTTLQEVCLYQRPLAVAVGGDEAAYVDFDLPEYTPRYEPSLDTILTH